MALFSINFIGHELQMIVETYFCQVNMHRCPSNTSTNVMECNYRRRYFSPGKLEMSQNSTFFRRFRSITSRKEIASTSINSPCYNFLFCYFKLNPKTKNETRDIVMSVWLPVKMCSWDRQFTYLVMNVLSSLIIFICRI